MDPITAEAAVRQFAEDLIAEIGSMRSMQSWSKVETEARRSAYDDVLAVISDRLARDPVADRYQRSIEEMQADTSRT